MLMVRAAHRRGGRPVTARWGLGLRVGVRGVRGQPLLPELVQEKPVQLVVAALEPAAGVDAGLEEAGVVDRPKPWNGQRVETTQELELVVAEPDEVEEHRVL